MHHLLKMTAEKVLFCSTKKTRKLKQNPYCIYENLQFRNTLKGIADNLSNIFKLWNRAEKKTTLFLLLFTELIILLTYMECSI